MLAGVSAGQDLTVQGLMHEALVLKSEDLVLEQRYDGGFHLFIRKKPGIGSVLVTETTRDPELRSDNYAYRAAEWNDTNGDEIRIIDGAPIPASSRLYSLISSTPVSHPALGEAFHIFVPWILQYGYDYTRHGEIYVANGTYLNLRTFNMPYGDYRGAFRDNPFILQVTQRAYEGPPGFYIKETEETFREIAGNNNGMVLYSSGPHDIVDKIKTVIEKEKGKSIDIVICLDTTASMKNDIDAIRSSLIPMLNDLTGSYPEWRVGIVLYKDYYDEYLTRILPFTNNMSVIQNAINSIIVRGGGDLPEAVYEALYDGITRFPWEADSRQIILIGDAPPHPRQRGRVSKEMVYTSAAELNIKVSTVILPQ